jgi:undecaprenyl-diphosphatase
MEILYTAILGIIQGLTEFLPISSSGHLVILQKIFGLKDGTLFLNLVLHTGTLAAVLVFFFSEIKDLFRSFSYQKNPDLYWIVLANIPTAIIGLTLKQVYEELSSLWIVGIMLLITASILFLIKNKQETAGSLTARKSLIIGAVQGIAAVPGISRSGSTIAVSLMMNVEKEKAFSFSFLLSVPAILGADLLIIKDFVSGAAVIKSSFPALGIGFILSFLTGLAALSVLKKFILTRRFHYFGYYCAAAGILSILGGLL